MQENNYVRLPKGVDDQTGNKIGMLRELIMEEFSRYKLEMERKDKGGS